MTGEILRDGIDLRNASALRGSGERQVRIPWAFQRRVDSAPPPSVASHGSGMTSH